MLIGAVIFGLLFIVFPAFYAFMIHQRDLREKAEEARTASQNQEWGAANMAQTIIVAIIMAAFWGVVFFLVWKNKRHWIWHLNSWQMEGQVSHSLPLFSSFLWTVTDRQNFFSGFQIHKLHDFSLIHNSILLSQLSFVPLFSEILQILFRKISSMTGLQPRMKTSSFLLSILRTSSGVISSRPTTLKLLLAEPLLPSDSLEDRLPKVYLPSISVMYLWVSGSFPPR